MINTKYAPLEWFDIQRGREFAELIFGNKINDETIILDLHDSLFCYAPPGATIPDLRNDSHVEIQANINLLRVGDILIGFDQEINTLAIGIMRPQFMANNELLRAEFNPWPPHLQGSSDG